MLIATCKVHFSTCCFGINKTFNYNFLRSHLTPSISLLFISILMRDYMKFINVYEFSNEHKTKETTKIRQ